jgi:hypothetical protein
VVHQIFVQLASGVEDRLTVKHYLWGGDVTIRLEKISVYNMCPSSHVTCRLLIYLHAVYAMLFKLTGQLQFVSV